MTINFIYRNSDKKELIYSTNSIDPIEIMLDFQSFLVGIGYQKEKIELTKQYQELFLNKSCAEKGCPAIDGFGDPKEVEMVYRKIK